MKESHFLRFHLYKMSRIGKFIERERENRFVFLGLGVGGKRQ